VITLTFINTTNIQPAKFCGRSNITLQNNQCPCPIDEYLSSSSGSTCSLCSSGCGLCFSSAPQDCIQCLPGYYFDIINQHCTVCSDDCSVCQGPDPSQCDVCDSEKCKYWNGSCLADCPLPLEVAMSGSDLLCNFPCDNSEAFLYWDGFCSSVCPAPLNQRIEQGWRFCDYNCSSDQHLYENGTCSGSCESPLLKETFHNRSFCQHPCPNATDFIYWNHTCQETCPAPYHAYIQDSLFYCERSCQIDQFLYQNGSCYDACPFPFEVRIEQQQGNEIKYCDAPCPTGKIVLWDKSCLDVCEGPMRQVLVENFTTCQPPCADPFNYYYYPETRECKSECKPPYITSDLSLHISCSSVITRNASEISIGNKNNPTKTTIQLSLTMNNINSVTATVVGNGVLLDAFTSMTSNPAVTAMIIYIKVLQYIRYLDLNFPLKLENMLGEQVGTKSSLSFGPSLSEEAAKGFEDDPLPSVFERYNHYSSFLVNLYKFFSTLLILLLLILVSKGLKIMNKHYKWGLLSKILDKFEAVIKWNYILILVMANLSDIILYSSFEFRTLHIHSAQATFSFLFSIISVFGVIAFLYIAWYFPQKVYIEQKKIQFDPNIQSVLTKWKGCEMLWTGFTLKETLTRLFLFIYIMRIAIVYLIASYLFVSPLAQTTLYVLISLGSVVYLVKLEPLETRLSRFQVLTYESIVLGINIGLLFIAIFDASKTDAAQVRLFIGDMIIFGHVLFNFVGILFLGMKLGKKVIEVYKKYKRKSNKLKIGLEKLLMLPVCPQNQETLEMTRGSVNVEQQKDQEKSPNNHHSQNEEKSFKKKFYHHQRGTFLTTNNPNLNPFATSRKSSFYANSPRNNLSLNDTYGFDSGTTTPRIRFNMKEVGFSPKVDENEEIMSYREGTDSNRTGGMESNRRLLRKQRIQELRKGSIFEKINDADIEVESVRAFDNDEGNLSISNINKSEIDVGKGNNLSLDFTPRSFNRVFKTNLVNALSNLKFEEEKLEVEELEDENENSVVSKMEISFKNNEKYDDDFSFHQQSGQSQM